MVCCVIVCYVVYCFTCFALELSECVRRVADQRAATAATAATTSPPSVQLSRPAKVRESQGRDAAAACSPGPAQGLVPYHTTRHDTTRHDIA